MSRYENKPNPFAPKFKEILFARRLITPTEYIKAEETAKLYGQDIKEFLYKSGQISHLQIQQAIAISKGGELQVSDNISAQNYKIEHKLSADNGYNLIDNYDGLNRVSEIRETHEQYGFSENIDDDFSHPKFVTARDFRTIFIDKNKAQLDDQAANLLADKNRDMTAKFGMYFIQKLLICLCLFSLVTGFLIYGLDAFYSVSFGLSCIFLFASSLKLYSIFSPLADQGFANDYLSLPYAELPIYSILVPVYKEANVIGRLTKSLMKLNYPQSKLDIKILLEDDDAETIEAVKNLNLPEYFEFIIISDSKPKTKPKAMNFALPFVRGEYVTIYDAEDQPEPDQLLKSLAKFRREGADLACVQARLAYENWNENWLAKQFSIEYATQFNHFLPALAKLKIPLPLGGTSNHFKTDILRELGGWDAYNVTEDADLGIRLALFGYRAATLNSTTLEEANHKLFPWLKQRVRWLKGWMQTIIVHTRHPTKLYKKLGFFRFMGLLALLCGLVFSSLLHPIILLLPFILYFTFDLSVIFNSTISMFIFGFSLLAMVIGYGAALFCNYQAIAQLKRKNLFFCLLTAPIYWLLISLAAWLAIVDYLRDPFYWAKTKHGVSDYINNKAEQQEIE
ncbi:MAG: glycosyltransferase [Hyphomicrobiales bacterium]